MMAVWTRRGFLASGLALAACANHRPRLAETYGAAARSGRRPPLILIPGAFGSSLRSRATGREVWPASDPELLLSNYRSLELPIDPVTLEPLADGLEAYAVFREGLGRDFYGEVIDHLERVGGYRLVRPGQPLRDDESPLHLLLYDFRRDNLEAVRALDALVARIRADAAAPDLAVDILAHSNGGLIARYYARYGTAPLPETGDFVPTYAGVPAIRRLLLVGTPNLGTIQPVLSLLRGEEIGLRRIPSEVVATCPGLPQLMPHPAVPWLVGRDGTVMRANLYDVETWRDLRWGLWDPRIAERTRALHGGGGAGRRYLETLREFQAKHLRRGSRFIEALGVPAGPEDVEARVFGGDCELTLARLVVESVEQVLRGRERIADLAAPDPNVAYESAMFEPGDTVVTRSSLLGRTSQGPWPAGPPLRVAQATFLCEHHQQLTGNAMLIDNVLHALFSESG
ncbi:MAG: esterase/lipase family protein [Steroidobacteraceae bacterium]